MPSTYFVSAPVFLFVWVFFLLLSTDQQQVLDITNLDLDVEKCLLLMCFILKNVPHIPPLMMFLTVFNTEKKPCLIWYDELS